MASATVTIAWTEAEAVLFGPESRCVRLPLAPDDDRAALILETWRTEFPEIAAAQLLAGKELSAAPEVGRLAQLAGEAGLRLELAPPPGGLGGRRGRWAAWRGAARAVKPRAIVIGALVVGALLAAGWQWSKARERQRLGRLSAAERESELRQAETAEMSKRRLAATEEARALGAACAVPRQFQSEWLAAVAAGIPRSLVLDKLELQGARARLTGRVAGGDGGAEGAKGAVEAFRQAIFSAAVGWTVDSAEGSNHGRAEQGQAGASFRLEAELASVPQNSGIMLQDAAAARARLPDAIAVDALLKQLAPGWRIEAKEAELALGIQRRRYTLVAISKGPQEARAWLQVQEVARRLNAMPGVAIDSLELAAAPGENGALDAAKLEISVRVRAP